MTRRVKYPDYLVFGLDIGTRSIVGTVGYKEDDKFYVVAQTSIEHQTRAMLDGQIHDIGKVSETIIEVKGILEGKVGKPLTEVCIAAAGRVLRTITTHVEVELSEEREVTGEDVYAMDSLGVEKAYEEFLRDYDEKEKFYCVGYSVMKYYMNDFPISNLVNHKAKKISADLIATFLPDDVVDGLYSAVELSGLQVANLTLEPIAAIHVAIPEMYRMLNIALVDVGAGTSDICITREGSIIAYGMIPMAGDSVTEVIAQSCLVDFVTADHIKRGSTQENVVSYQDIMCIPQSKKKAEIEKMIEPVMEEMTNLVADKIIELNGGKSVSAVFIIGGGGKINHYAERLAQKLELPKERVALRGAEVMQNIEFMEKDVVKDSLIVTPIGICMNFYEFSNNFIYVVLNGKKIKLYNNGNLTIVDAAMQANFPNEELFPQRGKPLTFSVNGKNKIVRGELGEASVILQNGETSSLHSEIKVNDRIEIVSSTAGAPAEIMIEKLSEYGESITVIVNDAQVGLPGFVSVNGTIQSPFYQVQENDDIRMLNYYTIEQLANFMDVCVDTNFNVYVNNQLAQLDTPVYENFTVRFSLVTLDQMLEEITEERFVEEVLVEEVESITEESEESETENMGIENTEIEDAEYREVEDENIQKEATTVIPTNDNIGQEIVVFVNKEPVKLIGKESYVFVDIFDYIDIDLSTHRGNGLLTTVNGETAQYMKSISDGDQIEVYWKE